MATSPPSTHVCRSDTPVRLANGLTITGSMQAAEAISRFEDDLLHYRRTVPALLDSPAAKGDCPLGDAIAAALHLLALTSEGRLHAKPLIARAMARSQLASSREQKFIAAIDAWQQGRMAEAAARHQTIACEWPQDLISAKIGQFHQLNSGDFTGMLEDTTALIQQLPEHRHVQGMHAFALEQNGRLTEAERLGRKAADAGPDPWAHHAVAHVLDSGGRAAEGKAWMAQHSDAWEGCSSFMYTHNWWHAALFDIALDDHASALSLLDQRVWGVRRDCCQDQINAVSLLIRFEMLGLDVGDRWQDLAPHLERRIDDQANPFIDLHYAYGLARAGRDVAVERQRRGLWKLADHQPGGLRQAVAVAADGMVAHARRDYAKAAACLSAVEPSTRAFGGSRTQRRMVELVRKDSAKRASSR